MIRARRGGWQVIVYAGIDPLTGKQRYVSRQVNGGRREAERVEARLKTEVADGRHAGTRARRFGELLDMWLEWRQTNGKPISPTTLNNYRGTIETKIRPALGALPINRVDAHTLDRFYGQLRTRGNARQERWKDGKTKTDGGKLSASRVRDVHAIISGALGLAARWGWLPFNPAVLASPPAPRSAKRPVPTMDQVRELFAAVADDPEFELYIRLAVTTGLRPGELCALWWRDFDLDAQVVRVGANLVHTKGVDGGWLRKAPKSGHGERVLALDPHTVELLKEHHKRRQTELQAEGVELAAETFVFAGSIDGATPIRRDRMTKRFTALARRLGHGYTLYGLRHFMATQLGAVAAAGTVRDRMGHGSLAVTSGYMHPVSEADRAAARYMGELLDGRAAWRSPAAEGEGAGR